MAIDLSLAPDEVALLTDLYELTMAAAFHAEKMNGAASFSVSVRRMPPRRGYLVAAGLERLLEALEDFHFAPAAIEHLRSLQIFSADFLQMLSGLRFTGEVWAMPEGSLFFAEEPVVEIKAPLIEAQLLETLVLNQIGAASMVATKAARCVSAAAGRRLVDFGLRRSHGADAGLIAARSSYLTGFMGTSNVLAGKRYGIPVFGTMAHSYVMAHRREREAFEAYVATFPRLSTLLVDTYDTVRGVENAARVALELKDKGVNLQAVRLDSGNLFDLSRTARRLLDARGLHDVSIFGSGNLDEYAITELVRAGAPIDAFGVGTAMVTSLDAPALDIVYKLVEYEGRATIKTSQGKPSFPGAKQVFRGTSRAGSYCGDLVGVFEEGAGNLMREFRPPPAQVSPCLDLQMRDGKRIMPRPTLAAARARFTEEFSRLEDRYKNLERPDIYSVRPSAALNATLISAKVASESMQD